MILSGKRKDNYFEVEIELEDEGGLRGWVPETALSEMSPDKEKPEKAEDSENYFKPTKKKPRVPKDETLLLHRARTFYYGVHVGTPFSIMQTSVTADIYSGFGLKAGGHFGFPIGDNFLLHIEGSYNFVQGTGNFTQRLLQFGFVDMVAGVSYFFDKLEIFGGAKFAVGISLNDVDPAIVIPTAASLSSPYIVIGVGYRLPVTDIFSLTLRARYQLSFFQSPVWIQTADLIIYFDLSG